MLRLQDLRLNELAASYFILPACSNYKMHKNYERYATKAFYDTFRDVSNLENSRTFMIYNGSQTLSAIAFWFMALESYIATLLKICCTKFELDFEQYKKLSLTQRVQALVQLLELDKKVFNEFDIIGKIHEFSRFRNELFNERSIGEELEFHKTNFSPLPFLSNQGDTFQAILIVLEVVQRFQYVFAGVNTMPVIPLVNGEMTISATLDQCYKNILLPCFMFALNKHDLRVQLDLTLPSVTGAASPKFEKGDVQSLKATEEEDKCLVALNPEVTTNCLSTFNNYIVSYQAAEPAFLSAAER